mmetsp:Transcript_15029/g.44886  ORF Transcript_15029/g.44886 Transcript_15029/m.44886 type:complete len:178 (+) Transcript_15029:158-691(+)
MIKGIIIVNNLGICRLAKFYVPVHKEGESPEPAQQAVVSKVYRQVSRREDAYCNYVEAAVSEWGDDTKIIYRHYATLFFVFACTKEESDLGILDLIQVFVEALDKCFENVCELDLIFHSDKVHYILDEIVIAGLVLDTSITNIMEATRDMTRLHAKSISTLNELATKAARSSGRMGT